MTATQERLSALNETDKAKFTPVFESMDSFYCTIYFIVKNEHLTEQEKEGQYEERLRTIRIIKERAENILNNMGFDGKEWIADIASDYFEDYIAYREAELNFTNETFIRIVQRISQH